MGNMWWRYQQAKEGAVEPRTTGPDASHRHDEASMVVVDGGPSHNHTLWECPVCKRTWLQRHEHE